MKKILLILSAIVFLTINIHAEDATVESVTKLYVATFDRAPDKAGLDYWVDESGLSLEAIATSFFDQTETQSLYPTGTSSQDFINAIYANLFKRDPDSAGATYWQGVLDDGSVIKSAFILAVVNGAQGDDASILSNKTEVGLAFAQAGLNDTTKAKNAMSGITADYASVGDAIEGFGGDSSSEEDEVLPPKVPEEVVIDETNEDDSEVNEIRTRSSVVSQNVDIKYLTKDNLLRVTEYLNNAGYKSFTTKTVDTIESDFDANDKEYYIVTFKEGGYIVFDTNINANAIYTLDENAKYNTIPDEILKTVSLDWMSIIAEEVEVPLSKLRRSTRSTSRKLITKIVWRSGSSRTDFDLFVKNAKGEICAYYQRDKSEWGTKHLHDDRGGSYKTSYEAYSVDLDKMDQYSTSINNFGNYKFYVSRYSGPNISYTFSYGYGGECLATNATNCPRGNWKRNVSSTGLSNALYAVRYTPKKVANTSTSGTVQLINIGSTKTYKLLSTDNGSKKYKFSNPKRQKIFFRTRGENRQQVTLKLYYSNNSEVNINSGDISSYRNKNNDIVYSFSKELNAGTYIIKVLGNQGTQFNLYTHEIKSEYKIPNVKLQTQIGAYRNACGFASSAMLYQFNHNTSPSISFVNQLAVSVGKAGLMSTIADNETALKRYDNNAYYDKGSFDDIKAYVSANVPVQVALYYYSKLQNYRASAGSNYNGGHSVVITGYSEQKGVWYINDPLETWKANKEVPSNYLRSAMNVTLPYILVLR